MVTLDVEVTTTLGESRPSEREGGMVRAPYLFLVMHCDMPLLGGARFSLAAVDEVVIVRGTERSFSRTKTADGRILTVTIPGKLVSRTHARFKRVLDAWIVVDDGSRNGVFVNQKRVSKATLSDNDIIECGHTLFVFRSDVATHPSAPADLDLGPSSLANRLVSLSPALETSHEILGKVAASKLPVLLLGESGTGKEIVARAVGEMSGRTGAFVAVNCGAIPPGLLESQLFGHVKGAFSGATRDEPGLFRAADRGTLFLDELGDLPPASQVAFLRVLEDGLVTSVGTTRGSPVDVRVVAATHRPLHVLAGQKLFREDLLARLSGFTHQLFPLRDRMEDLGILITALLPQLERHHPATSITIEAAYKLLAHRWPLNVRELRSCLASALIIAAGAPIEAAHVSLSPPIPSGDDVPSPLASPRAAPLTDVALRERLVALLTEHQGNIAAVARALGKAPFQIHRWLRHYDLDVSSFRPAK